MNATGQLLVRVVIAKITDRNRLLRLLNDAPVVQNDPRWNCVVWVQEAMKVLATDGKALGTSKMDWQTVRDTAMGYCQKKKDAHRFDGKGKFNMLKPATYDLLDRKETMP